VWIGVDTGGTFTDLVAFDKVTSRYWYLKLPSTPDDPARAILTGVTGLLQAASVSGETVEKLGHGTTLGTNALLEGKLPVTGMVTTRGFRDVLEIARQRRPHLFNLRVPKPNIIAARHLRMEVCERLAETGEVVLPVDATDVAAAAQMLARHEIESVAVCFLHAYANPAHELKVKRQLGEALPGVYICTSNDVLSEMREYERFATTVVNASLLPLMDRYLERLQHGLQTSGVPVSPRIMQSNGGAAKPETVRRVPVNTFFSGPAAGVIASARLGERLRRPDLMTFDMGGTSTDVCLIDSGQPAMQVERQIAGLPVRLATLDIHTVGAGGGSIGWVDGGGLLKVGPQSAGAVPGPAAYGRDGDAATVTDANFVLGRLSEADLLGGDMVCSSDKAKEAVARLADELNMDVTTAAAGMVRIVNVNMVGALRVVSVERGQDPCDYALVAFGGAGPLHVAEVAEQMGVEQIIVPARPGLASALGLLEADARADFSLTTLCEASPDSRTRLAKVLAVLVSRAHAWAEEEGHELATVNVERVADMRYAGQSFELRVPLDAGVLPAFGRQERADRELLSETRLDELIDAFHRRHEQLNGYASEDNPVEIVTLRLAAIVAQPGLAPDAGVVDTGRSLASPVRHQAVWFSDCGYVETPVFNRLDLQIGQSADGPAVIAQMDATTLVPPGFNFTVVEDGHLLMERVT